MSAQTASSTSFAGGDSSPPSSIHPSSILRAEDEDREHEYAAFVDDLAAIRRFVEAG